MVSTYWLWVVPMSISSREFFIDMISLDMKDYDVILDMDFLAKYDTSIDCRHRRVVFQLDGEEAFEFLCVHVAYFDCTHINTCSVIVD